MPVFIGTSGWHYQHWKGGFYPAGTGPSRWLHYYAEWFQTVEINNAFYRLPERSTFEDWARALPADFRVAVKASRYLTHIRRLKQPVQPVRLLMERAAGLGAKLGPILLQLPPNLRGDPAALDAVLAAFPEGAQVAVEPRHPTWFSEETKAVLEGRGAALCLADGGPVKFPDWRTTGWGYVRFHRGRAQPESCYGRDALDASARKVAEMWSPADDVFVYFNNDLHGCALLNAVTFARAVARAGLLPSTVPSRRQLGPFTS
jgi:uncharacterized protein YecE (DUF72 family)